MTLFCAWNGDIKIYYIYLIHTIAIRYERVLSMLDYMTVTSVLVLIQQLPARSKLLVRNRKEKRHTHFLRTTREFSILAGT